MNALDFNPFDGDFGDQGDRTLSDALVISRKAHQCSHCRGPIAVGERYRSRADIADGDLMRWKWCALCCDAMVSQLAGGFAFEERTPSRFGAPEAQPVKPVGGSGG